MKLLFDPNLLGGGVAHRMTRAEMKKLLELPAAEKMELAQTLWDSLEPEDETSFLTIADWQRQVLAERLADIERNPGDEQTWEEVKEEFGPKP